MIDSNMLDLANETFSHLQDDGNGTPRLYVDATFIAEFCHAVGTSHEILITEGMVDEEDPRIIAQSNLCLHMLEFYEALISKHADEISKAKVESGHLGEALTKILDEANGD